MKAIEFYTVEELNNMKWETIDIWHKAQSAHKKYPKDEDITFLYDMSVKRLKEVTKILDSVESNRNLAGRVNDISRYGKDKTLGNKILFVRENKES